MKFSADSRLVLSAIFSFTMIGQAMLQADVVTADDAVIQGSLVVGVDAVNGEVFGFDTIRLKENNTRISFVDTSSPGAFPGNDWVIAANDSASGGANYLGFIDKGQDGGASGAEGGTMPFRIQAGAAQGALWVDSNSRVGMGTTAPVLRLHLAQGDTPAIRLEQTGASGYTPQTWDVAGNEAGFFIRDVNAGSHLPFRIRPGAPSSSIDIATDGNVGIGTGSPTAKLHVDGTVFITQTLEIGSSRTRKENIRDLTLAEAQLAHDALNPVQFNYKTDTETQLGFIAEDVPDLVATQGRKSLVPMDFIAVLTKVSQHTQARVQSLEVTVKTQADEIAALEARLAKLEKALDLRSTAMQASLKVEAVGDGAALAVSAEHAGRQDVPEQVGPTAH